MINHFCFTSASCSECSGSSRRSHKGDQVSKLLNPSRAERAVSPRPHKRMLHALGNYQRQLPSMSDSTRPDIRDLEYGVHIQELRPKNRCVQSSAYQSIEKTNQNR